MTQRSLLATIGTDFKRHAFVLLLALFVLGSALSVVYVSHLQRLQIAALDRLQQERDTLDIEWRHLLLEENALAEHTRIEYLARKELGMLRPSYRAESALREGE